MKKLKIGIIGIGRLGYEHACNIANRVPACDLVAISDKNITRAKEVAEELGVSAVYENPADLCNDPNVEAVAIVTNTDSHVDMIELAMNAGKHVFCEKPLAETVEKCKRAEKIVEAHPNEVQAYRNGKTNLLGFFVALIKFFLTRFKNHNIILQARNCKSNLLKSNSKFSKNLDKVKF